jgi:hypothetical protein
LPFYLSQDNSASSPFYLSTTLSISSFVSLPFFVSLPLYISHFFLSLAVSLFLSILTLLNLSKYKPVYIFTAFYVSGGLFKPPQLSLHLSTYLSIRQKNI